MAIAAVTVAEMLVGVELAKDKHRAAHARLLGHVRRIGRPRGAHDLIIAATATATGRTVLTADASAAFGDLPGVDVLTVDRR